MVNLLLFEFCGNMFCFAFVVRLLGVLGGCFLSVFLEGVRCVSGVLKIWNVFSGSRQLWFALRSLLLFRLLTEWWFFLTIDNLWGISHFVLTKNLEEASFCSSLSSSCCEYGGFSCPYIHTDISIHVEPCQMKDWIGLRLAPSFSDWKFSHCF